MGLYTQGNSMNKLTAQTVLVLTEREALTLIANYPTDAGAENAASSMRMIANHTLVDRSHIVAGEAAAPTNKEAPLFSPPYSVSLHVGSGWAKQKELFAVRESAIKCADEYTGPVIVEDSLGQLVYEREGSSLKQDSAAPIYTMAYEGAQEEMRLWRRRAQETEAKLREIRKIARDWFDKHETSDYRLRQEAAETAMVQIIGKDKQRDSPDRKYD